MDVRDYSYLFWLYIMKKVKLIFSISVVLLLNSCSSFFSGSEPQPMNAADRDIVNKAVSQLSFIPSVVNLSNEETIKIYVFAFDGTENDRENFDENVERQTIVGYLSSKLQINGVDVEYAAGPGVGSKLDSAICYTCDKKAHDSLTLLEDKITSDKIKNPNIDIKIVVLGFSRGAAIGRYFMNLISDKWTYDDPTTVRTYGLLFDTVATSVTNELMLGIAPTSDYLVHIIARDERREMFPVIIDNDLAYEARKLDNLVTTPRLAQLTLPGVHSDIGASYKSGVGTFYRYLGEIILSHYGLLPQPVRSFNEDYFSQGSHDSRGWFSRLIGANSYLDEPNSVRERIIKNSRPISNSRVESIKSRNENNIPDNYGSFFQYTESDTVLFKVKKVGNDLKVLSANTTDILTIENFDFEIIDGKKYITYEFAISSTKSMISLDSSVWNAIPENKLSTVEVGLLKRDDRDEIFILVNNKLVQIIRGI